MREKQTDEGQEAPIQPQIALTTEKKPASFNVSAIGLQYVLVCSITIRISPPSFLSVDASFFKSLFVWWTSKGRSTIVQLKQCFVLSAHLHCSLGLGICIAHWL